MNKLLLAIIITGGLLVLISYIPLIKNYCHDMWVGIGEKHREVCYPLIVSATVGFIMFSYHFCQRERSSFTKGIFRKKFALETLVATILIFSALWSLFMYLSVVKKKGKISNVLTVLSLVIVAISSVILLAGVVEDGKCPNYVLAGVLGFCVTTVLIDAVAWNSNFIIRFR